MSLKLNLILIPVLLLLLYFIFTKSVNHPTKQEFTTQSGFEEKINQAEGQTIDSAAYQFGEYIFSKDCHTCHAGKYQTDNFVFGKVESLGIPYFKLYITKQDSLIEAKDKYSLSVKKVYGNMKNSHNFKFSDAQMNALISFIQ
jgi:hypothetical protein